jgi:hypothetical protein
MILLIPFLRRFSVRTRTIIGAAVTALAVVLGSVGAFADGRLVRAGVIAVAVGLAFLASASYDRRRAARTLERDPRTC